MTATFTPLEPATEGGEATFKAAWVVHLKNTGDVPLNVRIDAIPPSKGGPIALAVGESKDVGPFDFAVYESDVASGSWRFVTTGRAYSPKGAQIDAGLDVSVPFFTGRPTPAPTVPATPTPGQSQPATPAPTPGASIAPTAAAPAVTVTIAGTFDTKPGEPVKEGTRVEFTYDVKNTGGVDLTDVLGHKKFAVGESFRLTTTEAVVTAQNLKDGFVPAESKLVRGTLPNGSRVTVSEPFVYKLPIPEKPPIPAEAPDLDVKVSGTFEVKEGEPVVAGTKVKWVAAVTNTGNVVLSDVQVADSDTIAELAVGETGVVSFESTVTERDVFNHSIFVASLATATAPDGTTFTKNALGTLGIPAVTPVPVVPVPQPIVTPTSTPAPTPTPAPTSTAAAGSRPAADVTVPAAPAAATASTRSNAGHLASTGSDAAAVLPAAGVLALLGAVGVFLGRRRRSRSATE